MRRFEAYFAHCGLRPGPADTRHPPRAELQISPFLRTREPAVMAAARILTARLTTKHGSSPPSANGKRVQMKLLLHRAAWLAWSGLAAAPPCRAGRSTPLAPRGPASSSASATPRPMWPPFRAGPAADLAAEAADRARRVRLAGRPVERIRRLCHAQPGHRPGVPARAVVPSRSPTTSSG